MLYVNDKDLVVPGEVLAEGDYYSGRGTFEENGKICSKLLGLISLRNKKINVVPLKSKYLPKKGDVVIGKIKDVRFSMWEVDLNSPYSGILPASEVFGREKKELSRVFNVGDVLFLRIVDVDEVKKVKLGLKGRGMGKFKGGIVVDIAPTKVPRLIGKKGSMINMIKNKTGCKIVVGQNGLVWVKGDDDMEQLVKMIIKLIEKEAHTSGLTDRIKNKLCLEIDGELPEDAKARAEEEERLNEEAVNEGLKAPVLQDFKSELEEELAANESVTEEVDSEEVAIDEAVDSEEVVDEAISSDELVSDDLGSGELISDDVLNSGELVSDDVLDSSEEFVGEELDDDTFKEESIVEDMPKDLEEAFDKLSEETVEKDIVNRLSEEISEETDVKSKEELVEGEELSEISKPTKKQTFLDTFTSIKKQEKKNGSFKVSRANNNSPTINLK